MWHDPNVTAAGRRQQEERERLEAEQNAKKKASAAEPTKRRARIIAGPAANTDPRELEQQRLLARVLAAEGRPAITRAATDYRDAELEFPRSQQVWLQLLEHNDEEMVGEAIAQLTEILDTEPPMRRAVLDSRLRRIEQFADEPSTQQAATQLRRMLSAKHQEALDHTPPPPSSE